jgi:hypothetical protein
VPSAASRLAGDDRVVFGRAVTTSIATVELRNGPIATIRNFLDMTRC